MQRPTATAFFAVAALLAAMLATGAPCPAAVLGDNDIYDRRGVACAGFTNCTTRLCACTGSSNASFDGCFANASGLSCATAAACLRTYVLCLNTLAVDAGENTVDPCAAWAVTVLGELISVASSGDYAGSPVAMSCNRTVCRALSLAGKGDTCSTALGANNSVVCTAFAVAYATDAPVSAANLSAVPVVTAGPTPPSAGGIGSGVSAASIVVAVALTFLLTVGA